MIIEGIGTYGIVLSTPRIPFSNENFENVKNLNQVSKILFLNLNEMYLPPEEEDIYREYISLREIIDLYPNIFTNEYFMLPIDGGTINKIKLLEMLRNERILDLTSSSVSNSYIKIISSLLQNKQEMYQITYEKGEKINLNFEDFLDKINNIFNIIKISNDNGIFFDDIKLENLIFHDNKIKIIDYSNPININTSVQNIITQLTNSKLSCVFYHAYPIVPNILLFEFIDKLDLIGRFDSETQNYTRLIGRCFLEYETNAMYKCIIIDDLTQIYKKNISTDIIFEIKVLNFNNIDKIQCLDDINLYSEIKTITMNDFLNSFKLFLLCNYYNNDDIKTILVKEAIIGYKNIIKKIYVDLHEQIKFLLKTINQHSLGMILLNWLQKKKSNNTGIEPNNFIKILEIAVRNCINILLIGDTDLYYVII